MANISVVILSFNRLQELRRNIELLLDIPEAWEELLIIDNASTDGSQEYLRTLDGQKIQVFIQEKNLGVAAGRNVGFRKAKNELIICLDDDALLSPNQFRFIEDAFRQEPDLGVLAPLVIHGKIGKPQNPHGNCRVEIANYHGAAHVWRKEAIERIGLLDEQCVFGGEELDSCIRLYEAGYHCVFFPEITAYHYSFSRPGNQGLDRVIKWTFNYARVLYKYFPIKMARWNADRLLIARVWHGLRRFGWSAVFKILTADRRGRIAGLAQHTPVSSRTVAFYSNPALRPEFGNVPLVQKALRK